LGSEQKKIHTDHFLQDCGIFYPVRGALTHAALRLYSPAGHDNRGNWCMDKT